MGYNLRSRSRAGIAEPETLSSQEGPSGEVDLHPRSPQKKALENEYILREILNRVSVEDLVECRRVNKVWNEVATGLFIPKGPLIKFESRRSLERFVDRMSNSRKIPCRSLAVDFSKLGDSTLPEENSLNHPHKFLERVASFARHLIMSPEVNGAFPKVELTEKVVEYPDLKTAVFRIVTYFRSSKLLESRVDIIIGILSHAPKLENITFVFHPEVKETTFFHVMEHVPWTQLQYFKLCRTMKDEDFNKMIELCGRNLKLKTFRFFAFTLDDNTPRLGKNFFMFLERQRGTLETLSLELEIMLEPDFALPFPTLPNLTKLELGLLDDSFILALRAVLRPIAQRLPILRTIIFYTIVWSDWERFFGDEEDQVPVETVKTLEFGCIADYLPYVNRANPATLETLRRTVRKADKMFPRVKNLTVPVNLTLLTAIELEKVWGDVEKLTLLCGGVDNAETTLTGYSEEERNLIRKMGRGSRLFQTVEREAERNIFQFLKQVKVLELNHMGNKVGCLSDVGCCLVLMKLENLECLDLLKHKPDQVSLSEEVIREMEGKFQVVRKKAKKCNSNDAAATTD